MSPFTILVMAMIAFAWVTSTSNTLEHHSPLSSKWVLFFAKSQLRDEHPEQGISNAGWTNLLVNVRAIQNGNDGTIFFNHFNRGSSVPDRVMLQWSGHGNQEGKMDGILFSKNDQDKTAVHKIVAAYPLFTTLCLKLSDREILIKHTSLITDVHCVSNSVRSIGRNEEKERVKLQGQIESYLKRLHDTRRTHKVEWNSITEHARSLTSKDGTHGLPALIKAIYDIRGKPKAIHFDLSWSEHLNIPARFIHLQWSPDGPLFGFACCDGEPVIPIVEVTPRVETSSLHSITYLELILDLNLVAYHKVSLRVSDRIANINIEDAADEATMMKWVNHEMI